MGSLLRRRGSSAVHQVRAQGTVKFQCAQRDRSCLRRRSCGVRCDCTDCGGTACLAARHVADSYKRSPGRCVQDDHVAGRKGRKCVPLTCAVAASAMRLIVLMFAMGVRRGYGCSEPVWDDAAIQHQALHTGVHMVRLPHGVECRLVTLPFLHAALRAQAKDVATTPGPGSYSPGGSGWTPEVVGAASVRSQSLRHGQIAGRESPTFRSTSKRDLFEHSGMVRGTDHP